MEDKVVKFPITFEKLQKYEIENDTRFLRTKIWLMHLHENLNFSYFSKEAVEKAIPSLANTPILGYIEVNDNGEEDFSDHRHIIVKENGKYKFKYIGQAYGVIPEDNNAKFEMRTGSDGIEREYLTVEGLLWRKWDDPIEIMENDEAKGQSMELDPKSIEGFKNEKDDLFHFTNFKFFGACILGDDVLSAMQDSTIEVDFSFDEFNKEVSHEIQNKMEQFRATFTKYQESADDHDIDNQEIIQEGGNQMAKNGKENKEDFSLTSQQLTEHINNSLKEKYQDDDWGWKLYDFYYVDHDETKVIAQSRHDNFSFVRLNYSMKGDFPVVDFDSKSLVKIVWTDMEGEPVNEFNLKTNEIVEYEVNVKESELNKQFKTEKEKLQSDFTKEKESLVQEKDDLSNQLNDTKEQFSTVEQENTELKKFKSTTLKDEHETKAKDLISQFEQLDEEDVKDIAEKMHHFSLKEIEETLYTLLGRKLAKFSKNPKPKVESEEEIKFDNQKDDENDDDAYGGLMSKHGKKPTK